MSVVYWRRTCTRPKVALKVIAPELSDEQGFRERFRLESRLAASIDHPMSFRSSKPARPRGSSTSPCATSRAATCAGSWTRRSARARPSGGARRPRCRRARCGPRAGLVHRDVKPSNVLIASPGEHEHVYLADFGLTKTAESEEEARSGPALGDDRLRGPGAHHRGGAGKSADVYALGCVLYEALTGEVPYPRDSELETLVAHRRARAEAVHCTTRGVGQPRRRRRAGDGEGSGRAVRERGRAGRSRT